MFIKRYINFAIPISFVTTVFVFTGIFYLIDPSNYASPLFHMTTGGLIIGAFFMATDLVTSPITPLGSWIFGLCAGLILFIIGLFGGVPEGVM